jgi:predicted 2-oxoglutarate/Fe(II)-dependent dioxygenase YbiX
MRGRKKDFFSNPRLFFIESNFWSAEECWQLRQISRFGKAEYAGIYSEGQLEVNPDFRKTKRVMLTPSLHKEIERSIWTAKPRLEEHFDLQLTELQGSQLLVYEPGDYFHTHQDEGRTPSIHTRKISIVIFLNTEFEGGDIVFYQDAEHLKPNEGFHFRAEEGLLLAFSPYLHHEVQSVTGGVRYCIVTWFV